MSATTIKIQPKTKEQLDHLKLVYREPYDSVIQRLLKEAKKP